MIAPPLVDLALARKVLRTFEEERRLAAQDRRNADVFAAAAAGIDSMEQIVYLGGLGDDDDERRAIAPRKLRHSRKPVSRKPQAASRKPQARKPVSRKP